MSTRADVVVVGAGLSGLTCALRLHQAGAKVLVLEARQRVGGRACSATVEGAVVDMGAQWITPGQDRVVALAREFDVPLVPDQREGAVVVGHDPAKRGSLLSRLPLLSKLELPRSIQQLEAMSRSLSPASRELGPHAESWDRMSLAAWIGQNTRGDRTRAALGLLAELNFAAPPEQISLLHFLWSLAASGSLSGGELRGAGERRVQGGAQHLCQRVADALPGQVSLGTPVTHIGSHGERLRVTHLGATIDTRRVVLAVPPPLQRQIHIPPLAAREQPAACMAGVIKCALTYERRFWHEDRNVGEAYGVHGRVRAVVDATRQGGPPLLLVFVVGDAARELSPLDTQQRRPLITGELAQLLGPDAARSRSFVDKDWLGDPWSLGCELALAPGQAAPYLRTAHRPAAGIHFAGTETATRWPRFLEGAVHAGERAAREVLQALGGDGAT